MSSSNGAGSSGKPPHFIECSVCGKEFGSRSIGIHEPQCLQKLRRTEIANNSSSEQGKNGRGMRRKKKSSKKEQQQGFLQQKQQNQATYSDQYYGAFEYQHRTHVRHRNTPPAVSYVVDGGEKDEKASQKDVVETNKIILPRIQPNSLINYKALSDQCSSSYSRRPRTATLPRPKILNLDFIQYDMSLTRLDFSPATNNQLANLAASSSSASSPSPVDPSFALSRMDDNQNSICGNSGVVLPAVTTSAPSNTKSKLSKISDVMASGATKLPPTKDDVDPLQKWSLSSSSSGAAVDNESLGGSPLRQSGDVTEFLNREEYRVNDRNFTTEPEDDNSIMTSEADEFHSLMNTETEDEEIGDLDADDDTNSEVGVEDIQPDEEALFQKDPNSNASPKECPLSDCPTSAISSKNNLELELAAVVSQTEKNSSFIKQEAEERSQSTTSSENSHVSVLETFRNFVGSIVPSCMNLEEGSFFSQLQDNNNNQESAVMANVINVTAESHPEEKETVASALLEELVTLGTEGFQSEQEEKVDAALPKELETVGDEETSQKNENDNKPTEAPLSQPFVPRIKKCFRFHDELTTNILPSEESSSVTNIYHFNSNASPDSSSSHVLTAHQSPSENNLAGHRNPAILGSGSESDDEDEGSYDDMMNVGKFGIPSPDDKKMYFPAHEVTSSRTLIRKKLYKKRSDKNFQSSKNIECNGNDDSFHLKSNGKEDKKTEKVVRIKEERPSTASSLTSPAKSATDSNSNSSKSNKLSLAVLKILGDSKDAGDISSNGTAQRKKRGTSSATTKYISPYQAQAVVVSHLVNALAKLKQLQKEKDRKLTKNKERPHTVHVEYNFSGGSSYQPSTCASTTTNPSVSLKAQGRTPWTTTHRTAALERKVAQGATTAKRPWTSHQTIGPMFDYPSLPQSREKSQKQSTTSFKKAAGPWKKSSGNTSNSPCFGCNKSYSVKITRSRNETIDRLATPKALAESRTCCVERPPLRQRKLVTGTDSRPQTARSTASSRPSSKTSVVGDREVACRRLKLSPIQHFHEEGEDTATMTHLQNMNSGCSEKKGKSIQILVAKNLSSVPSTEASLPMKKVSAGGILKRPEDLVSQSTQTRRKWKRRGILKKSSGEKTASATTSKTVSICVQSSKSSENQGCMEPGARSYSTKSVRILHHPDHRQYRSELLSRSEESSCSATEEGNNGDYYGGHSLLLKSPKQIFKRELESINNNGCESENKMFAKRNKSKRISSSKATGEIAVCYDNEDGDDEMKLEVTDEPMSPTASTSMDIPGMGIANVTVVYPTRVDDRSESHVDLNIIVRRRNAEGSYPEIKELNQTITPNNLYFIINEENENNPDKHGSLSQFLCRTSSPSPSPPSPTNSGKHFSVYYGGRLC